MTIWSRTRPLFVSISGGSDSGKATLAKRIIGWSLTVSAVSIHRRLLGNIWESWDGVNLSRSVAIREYP